MFYRMSLANILNSLQLFSVLCSIMISIPVQEFGFDVFRYTIPLSEAQRKSYLTWQVQLVIVANFSLSPLSFYGSTHAT